MITLPTIAAIAAQVLNDLQTGLGAYVPLFGKNGLRAISNMQAAKFKLLYLAIGDVQRNIWPDTADPESEGGSLQRYGRVKLGRNPYAAVAGRYAVTVTGTIGAVFKAQLIFKSDDTASSPGKLYILDNPFTLIATSGSITLRALDPGEDSRLSVSDTLTATSPVNLASQSAVVTAETIQPLAAEDIEDYRRKVLQSFRLDPTGGSGSDYRLWSYDAQGVEQSYPYVKSGVSNEINLYVEATIADSTDGKGTPTTLILSDVADVIEFDPDTTRPLIERGRRPLGDFIVHVLAVTVLEVDITIPQVGSVFTTAQRTAITDALTTLISGIRPFVASADIATSDNPFPDVLNGNKVGYAITSALPGANFGALTIAVSGSPVFSFRFIDGDIPHLNSVIFT